MFEMDWVKAAMPRKAKIVPASVQRGPRTIATSQSLDATINATPGIVTMAIFSRIRRYACL